MLGANDFKQATLMKGSTWFVVWYNVNPDTKKLERVRKTFDLNRIEDLQKREHKFLLAVMRMNVALSRGYNYFDPKTYSLLELPSLAGASPEVIAAHMQKGAMPDIKKALKFALTSHSNNLTSVRSVGSYKSAVKIFFDWLDESGYAKVPTHKFTIRHAMEYIYFRQEQGLNNVTINTQRDFLHKLFGILKKIKEIAENPFSEIDRAKEMESNLFQEITPAELVAISSHLKERHPHFALFVSHIFYQWSRPTHIGRYQRSLYDFQNNRLRPFGDTTKNKKRLDKQLMLPLKKQLIEFDYHKLSPQTYIFGTKDFKPSLNNYASSLQRANDLWRELVIQELSIDKKMYAMKHTGATAYIQLNTPDVGWFQRQMEHSSLAEAEAYIRKRLQKKLNEAELSMLVF